MHEYWNGSKRSKLCDQADLENHGRAGERQVHGGLHIQSRENGEIENTAVHCDKNVFNPLKISKISTRRCYQYTNNNILISLNYNNDI